MKVWELEDRRDESGLVELVEEFTAGADVGYDQRLADYDILGSIAHVTGLEEIGLLTSSEAEELREGLRDLLEEEIELTSDDEDIHTRVENELTDELGELGGKLHTARSRNDQVMVDLRLYAKDGLFGVVDALFELIESLLELAEEGASTPMVGFTHSRKAMPSSVGLWAGSYAEALLDDLVPLGSSLELLDQSPLGAGAGYGVPVRLNRELTAGLLGFGKVQKNAIYVMNSRGKFEFQLLSGLAGVALDLSRLAEDLIVFSDEQFGYFTIPQPFTTGSSIMPQKKNPDVLELVRGRTSRFSGYLSEIFALLHGLRAGYSRDLQETKRSLMEGLDSIHESIEVLSPLIENLELNERNLKAAFSEEVFATDKVFSRVEKGEPFREAYRAVKEELGSTDTGGRIDPDRIRDVIESRDHQGGPGNLCLEDSWAELEEKRKRWTAESTNFRLALKSLGKKSSYGDDDGGER
ncbi:MAG: argininosuccinate lyase [Candidatus Acetothermia bacterium]